MRFPLMRRGAIFFLIFFQVGLGAGIAQAQSAKKLGEVPESKDSYRDPGFPRVHSRSMGLSLSTDSSINHFTGNRSPGLPQQPDFPNFRFESDGQVILYGTDRNGKKYENKMSRAEFEAYQEKFEKSQH